MRRRPLLATFGISLTGSVAGCLDRLSLGENPDDGVIAPRESSGNEPDDVTAVAQFQYDAQKTGRADRVSSFLEPEWTTELSPSPEAMVAADGTVFVVESSDLIALDAEDGNERWTVGGGAQVAATPAVSPDTVYVPIASPPQEGMRGIEANALDTGELRWRASSDVDIPAAPTLANGAIYVGGVTNRTSVLAIDATSGEEFWRAPLDQELRADQEGHHKFSSAPTPSVAEDTVFVGAGEEPALVALDAADGEEQWRLETDGQVVGGPTIYEDTIYVGTRNGRVHAVEMSGDERWANHPVTRVTASIAVNDDGLCIPGDGEFVAQNHGPSEVWRVDTTDCSRGPTVSDTDVIYGDRNRVVGRRGSDGSERWQLVPEERPAIDTSYMGRPLHPVVGSVGVFVTSDAGRVYGMTGPSSPV